MAEFVRSDPSMWEAVYADPSVPLDRALVRQIINDQRRLSRRWLYPIARVLSRVLVALISIVKRVLPFRWMPLHTMDVLCVWFLRRFVSPDAVELLIRHFVIETNLVNFIIRNTPVDMAPVTLRPETLSGLGDQAVVGIEPVMEDAGREAGGVGVAGGLEIEAEGDRADAAVVDGQLFSFQILKIGDLATLLDQEAHAGRHVGFAEQHLGRTLGGDVRRGGNHFVAFGEQSRKDCREIAVGDINAWATKFLRDGIREIIGEAGDLARRLFEAERCETEVAGDLHLLALRVISILCHGRSSEQSSKSQTLGCTAQSLDR